jgi:hypothetical protein
MAGAFCRRIVANLPADLQTETRQHGKCDDSYQLAGHCGPPLDLWACGSSAILIGRYGRAGCGEYDAKDFLDGCTGPAIGKTATDQQALVQTCAKLRFCERLLSRAHHRIARPEQHIFPSRHDLSISRHTLISTKP